jgi:NhaA family Na+:H+ antiporter
MSETRREADLLLTDKNSVRLRMARPPTGVSWKVILGAGRLAGIGFTMALFTARLALRGRLLEEEKPAIPVGALGVVR